MRELPGLTFPPFFSFVTTFVMNDERRENDNGCLFLGNSCAEIERQLRCLINNVDTVLGIFRYVLLIM